MKLLMTFKSNLTLCERYLHLILTRRMILAPVRFLSNYNNEKFELTNFLIKFCTYVKVDVDAMLTRL